MANSGVGYYDVMKFHFGFYSLAEAKTDLRIVRAYQRLKNEGLVKHLAISQLLEALFARTAEDTLDDEKVRLEKGLSSDLDVLKYQRDASEAKARELAALADLNGAFVQIEETSGKLFDDLNIHVSQAP